MPNYVPYLLSCVTRIVAVAIIFVLLTVLFLFFDRPKFPSARFFLTPFEDLVCGVVPRRNIVFTFSGATGVACTHLYQGWEKSNELPIFWGSNQIANRNAAIQINPAPEILKVKSNRPRKCWRSNQISPLNFEGQIKSPTKILTFKSNRPPKCWRSNQISPRYFEVQIKPPCKSLTIKSNQPPKLSGANQIN